MTRPEGEAKFFVLTETDRELFHRPWNCGDGSHPEVGPGEPVEGIFARVIAHGMPVPRDRAVLGWAPDRQVTAILSVHSGTRRARARLPLSRRCRSCRCPGPSGLTGRRSGPASRRRAALGLPGARRHRGYRPPAVKLPGAGLQDALPVRAGIPGRRGVRCCHRRTWWQMSTGCPPASTPSTGCSARTSPFRRPGSCSRCRAPCPSRRRVRSDKHPAE